MGFITLRKSHYIEILSSEVVEILLLTVMIARAFAGFVWFQGFECWFYNELASICSDADYYGGHSTRCGDGCDLRNRNRG
ncbi:MAG: hypothetical protein HOC70_08215 [Gammaproteobacteria bacterium]|jgi:hypothetical protein|nr:hypothetical protein [Gammaproteobacteria bacterium]MBT7371607.1 hypothetical protein [Gammaproteobacteria bacterium]